MIKKTSTEEGVNLSRQSTNPISENIWLHLGASAFFRAHQAYYLNQLKQKGNDNWHVSLANIRNSSSQETLKKLQQQNGAYTLEIISPSGDFNYQTIECLDQILLWDHKLQSTVDVGANPNTKIISFTVTEGGYFLKEDNHLDLEHPAIQNDLLANGEIQTLYGVLYDILDLRMKQQSPPVTLLCCDNLRSNGDSFAKGLHDFVEAKGNTALLTWIEQFTSSPNSMVDRITPKVNEKSIARVQAQQHISDAVPISCEHYTRWVLEKDFVSDRPDLAKVGVEFVDDVVPYEEAKIRLLNASHSGLAWFGALHEHIFIHETLAHSICNTLTHYAKYDVKTALESHKIYINTDVECKTILDRFSSPYVKDTVARVASDSISKLRGFILPTIKDCLAQNKIPEHALKLVASYFYFLKRYHQDQLPFEYLDSALNDIPITQVFQDSDPVFAFATHIGLFGSLAEDKTFYTTLIETIHSFDLVE
ncbi:mannitol dehydrogenase family protein [Acinetobacter boissieri]|uniref:D-arabinitol 4-dehydrogenase n=1 Tax=Acinetobacter boissieri TaxID=1219383 RepID=A0A1G6GT15_9GAMM|nr:mannitol dehydrogenase family protein [Acinetobacter boissieri]SDB85084.1 D-arabinitol 4-dehydrogenase [Acinetobacter boissieri]